MGTAPSTEHSNELQMLSACQRRRSMMRIAQGAPFGSDQSWDGCWRRWRRCCSAGAPTPC
jgi:hypothetical protein